MGGKKRKPNAVSATKPSKKAKADSNDISPPSYKTEKEERAVCEKMEISTSDANGKKDCAVQSQSLSADDSGTMCLSFSGSTPVSTTVGKFPHVDEMLTRFQEVSQAFKDKPEIDLPESVNILKFVESRALEIETLMQEIKQKRPKQAIQQLPRHMRRRVASHNVKRVPRRLRAKAESEISKAKKTKRPSRKYRRRPSNLLSEYHRRARKTSWLETHIWHAKRFKMQKHWGYYIPIHPNDKNLRSSYRAVKDYTMLQDMSYLCCIELLGPLPLLLLKLCQLTDTSTGLTFAAKACLSGPREGTTVIYHPGTFPFQAIGPVSFMWQPADSSQNSNSNRKIWMWCHPSMHQELVSVLKKLFVLEEISCNEKDVIDSSIVTSNKKDSDSVSVTKDKSEKESKTQPEEVGEKHTKEASKLQNEAAGTTENKVELSDEKFSNRFKKHVVYSGSDVKMTILQDNLIRYRLIGPRSHAILANTLKAAKIHDNVSTDKWWQTYCSDESAQSVFSTQRNFWERRSNARTPAELPSKLVLGLTVKDPRLDIPPVKIPVSAKFRETYGNGSTFHAGPLPSSLSDSPIWDISIREKVTAGKIPEWKLNQMRSKHLIPGTRLEQLSDQSHVPVLVVQQPGNEGYGAGYDLIAPLGWGMAFWIAFIYRGARAFGLRELKTLFKDSASPMPPYSYPDSNIGKKSQEENRLEMMEKHFRYPPAKRPSFKKLGVLNPFFIPWELLVREWASGQNNPETPIAGDSKDSIDEKKDNSFFVLRNKKQLSLLKGQCELLAKCFYKKCRSKKDSVILSKNMKDLETLLLNNSLNINSSIVSVQYIGSSRGTVFMYSGVYMPDESDLLKLKGNFEYTGPTEEIHSVEKIIKEKRKRRQKKKTSSTKAVVAKPKEDDERLIIPAITELTSHCKRKLIGYVESGGYSYRRGRGYGIGHCAVIPLVEAIKICSGYCLPPVVLVRSQNSLQYRVCVVDVI